MNKFFFGFACILIAFTFSFSATAQQVKEPAAMDSSWSTPYPPFRIAGNLYYVGTADLACYLITTSKGNILINTGLASSDDQIKESIESLGFKFSDIKILLTTQAHYDHVGAMGAIKKMTSATMMADAADAKVLLDGGRSDYAFGGKIMSFAPVKADRLLHNNDVISLGEMKIKMLHHPGHTKGSCSYLFTVKDEQRSWKVLIANMPSIVTSKKFTTISEYPGIAKDYAYTLNAMKKLSFDIWLASHAGQFDLDKKHQPGDAYNPAAFEDRKGYDEALDELQKSYDKKVSE